MHLGKFIVFSTVSITWQKNFNLSNNNNDKVIDENNILTFIGYGLQLVNKVLDQLRDLDSSGPLTCRTSVLVYIYLVISLSIVSFSKINCWFTLFSKLFFL